MIQSGTAMVSPDKSSGIILGRVFDMVTESPVEGAVVTALNQETGFEYTNISAADGTFFIPSLPSGWYTVSAESKGFDKNSLADYPVRISGTIAEPAQIGLGKSGAGKTLKTPNLSLPPPVIREKSQKADSQLEVLVHWDAPVNATSINAAALQQTTNTGSFSLIQFWQISGSAPRQRAPELSSNQLLAVISDENGKQRSWALIPDPRIIRAESPGPTGELSGQILYRSDAEFLITLPEALLPSTLKFYQIHWTGKEFALDFIGTISLP